MHFFSAMAIFPIYKPALCGHKGLINNKETYHDNRKID